MCCVPAHASEDWRNWSRFASLKEGRETQVPPALMKNGGDEVIPSSFHGIAVDLTGDKKEVLLVEMACNSHNCPVWMYQKRGDRYVELLSDDATTIVGFRVLQTRSHGLPDIQITQHDSSTQSEVRIHRFDGKKYRFDHCFVEQWISKEETKTTPIRCD